MRIISGKNRGRKLFSFDGEEIRPTSDKAREALFAILGNVQDLNFLDLCCGTGAIGLEAESRGANVVMVDCNKKSLELAKKNAELIKSEAKFVLSDALAYLKNTDKKFDVIFIDPPYKISLCGQAVKIIEERSLLFGDGTLIYERDVQEDFSGEKLKKYKEKKYGKAYFSFYGENL